MSAGRTLRLRRQPHVGISREMYERIAGAIVAAANRQGPPRRVRGPLRARGYATPGLPEVPVYLRRKFEDLSDEGAAKVERYIERIRKQEGGADGERDR